MTVTWVEFVTFETAAFEEVDDHGASTIETTPAPRSAKETYVVKVVADTGADKE